MKRKWVHAYMDMAERFSLLSSARRLKVGAIIVKGDRVLSIGYNGTPAGWDNNCEDEVVVNGQVRLVTKPEVIHAEANAVLKLARDGESGNGSTIFCTHSPCVECAKMIIGSGIKRVIYRNEFARAEGKELLQKCGVEVLHEELF